jgi:hypothetical protein
MKIHVSLGEAIDKYSILELKLDRIINQNKKLEIKKEIDILSDCLPYIIKYDFYYKILKYINGIIWDMTDNIKNITPDDIQFSDFSNKIFEFNQKRFRIKNWLNIETDSNLKEQKGYNNTYCKIIIKNEETIYDKISEIIYLSLEYDNIFFETIHSNTLERIFKIPTIIYDYNIVNEISSFVCINLESYILLPYIDRTIFEMTPISYLVSGFLGDFIQSLSVVNELFYKTGKKGIIYLSNKPQKFNRSLESTYNDTYKIINNQRYINKYNIFNFENYDIDLNSWRIDLYNLLLSNIYINWETLYTKEYNVEWGKHKWLDIPYDSKYKDFVFINTSIIRWPIYMDFASLKETYGENLVFITSDPLQYNDFTKRTSLHIPFHICHTFDEICICINSCKLFIGALSSPLSIAHACNKDRIIGLREDVFDTQLVSNLQNIWSNISYS